MKKIMKYITINEWEKQKFERYFNVFDNPPKRNLFIAHNEHMDGNTFALPYV